MTQEPRNIGSQLSSRFDEVARDSSSQHLTIAGRSIEIRHSSLLSREMFAMAFSHLETTPGGEADAVFRVGLGQNFLDDDPALHGLAVRPAASDGLRISQVDSTSLMVENAGITWWDSVAGDGGMWHWSKEPELARRASPLLNLVDAWGASRGLPVVHCAAIGTTEGMIVLGAPGGSGKSTLAVAALQHGLSYCGDDYCVLEASNDGEATVHSLFSTAKLDRQSQQLVPNSAALLQLPGLAENGRSVFQLGANPGLVRSGVVASVVRPVHVGGARSRLVEVSSAEALRSTAVTSAMLLPHSRPLVLGQVASMCRSVPCYRLEMGDDLGEAVATVATLLD